MENKHSGARVSALAVISRIIGEDSCRKFKLVELKGCGGYFGKRSDRLLLPVLKDAVARGLDKKLVQRVFERYRCIPGARYGRLQDNHARAEHREVPDPGGPQTLARASREPRQSPGGAEPKLKEGGMGPERSGDRATPDRRRLVQGRQLGRGLEGHRVPPRLAGRALLIA